MKLEPPLDLFGELALVCWSAIDERHVVTGKCKHLDLSTGELDPTPKFIAIAGKGESYYLMRFNDKWEFITDTWHESLAEARSQAEFEYSGVSGTWESIKST